MPIFVSGALQASVMTGLHVCWGLLCSDGVEKHSIPTLIGVTLSHMVSVKVDWTFLYMGEGLCWPTFCIHLLLSLDLSVAAVMLGLSQTF